MKSWPKHFLEARLPLPPLRLIGNSHLNLVPDYTEVELAGLVLHVSAMEVERNPGMEREYRWCIVRDSEGTVLVKIYTAGGIAAVKQRIVPGSHLFATDLAVISSPAVPGSLKERRVYLQATLSTQVWVFDPEHTEGLWFAETAAGQFIDPGDRPTDYTGRFALVSLCRGSTYDLSFSCRLNRPHPTFLFLDRPHSRPTSNA
jgi:hypothetical protein